jgi:hypothetical protein
VKYNATLIADAERPSTYTLGRFTYVARPVSAPCMLRFHAARASGDVVRSLVCLWGVLRAAFPARWWYRLWPSLDPARAILSLPDDLREKALASLFRIPGSGASAVADEDPVEVMRRIQREQAYGKAGASGPALTLAVVVMRCRATLTDAWYYDPSRYQTVDGFVPYRQAYPSDSMVS